ncbi:MAG TPA: hypothetical protein VGC79_34365 [Polyangiaceae bacterium]
MKIVHRIASLLALGVLAVAAGAKAAPDSRGTDFWLSFPTNYTTTPVLSLFIAGETATTGTVSVLGTMVPFSVTPGVVTTVILPAAAQASTTDGIESKGIHVVSGQEVTVYGLNRIQYTTDAYLGLPTDILGTDYIVLAYPNTGSGVSTEFSVAATHDNTVVTIKPSVTTGSRIAGVPYNVSLSAGQTYQLRNSNGAPADLTGTIITSNAPIAVFGAHSCANIPDGGTGYCDHVVEEIPPTSTWGRNFVTYPLASRHNGDTFRILAQADNTQVRINGALVATLNRGQVRQQIINGASQITSSAPILVAQYSNGTTYDGVTSDPFMMLVPPQEQFLASYTVTTPATGFRTNFINVVSPSAGVGALKIDGVVVPAASFSAIGSSGYLGAQLTVGLGSHRLISSLPFGAFVYGFDTDDSYGYPGGMSLSPVAVVSTISLAPKTATNPVNTPDCVTATLQDQFSQPVVGVRVDFAVTGPNAQLGFASTEADGTAKYCYSGATAGVDTIVGSVGSLSDTAAKTWTKIDVPPVNRPPSCALTAVIAGPPKQLQITVQDPDDGLESIEVTTANNADVVVPTFTDGDTSVLVVVASKIDPEQGSTVALRLTDKSGLVTLCDPEVPGVESPGSSTSDSISLGESTGASGGCSVVNAPGRANTLGLLAGALAGLALLRRRRGSKQS